MQLKISRVPVRDHPLSSQRYASIERGPDSRETDQFTEGICRDPKLREFSGLNPSKFFTRSVKWLPPRLAGVRRPWSMRAPTEGMKINPSVCPVDLNILGRGSQPNRKRP